MSRRATTETIITAMRILAEDIQSEDGVANAAIREAADRLAELNAQTNRQCVWTRRDGPHEAYDLTCGAKWGFGKYGRFDSTAGYVKFCPRCGGRVKAGKP